MSKIFSLDSSEYNYIFYGLHLYKNQEEYFHYLKVLLFLLK